MLSSSTGDSETFSAKYEQGKTLGKGSFGEVFKATNRITREVYAAKKVKVGDVKQRDIEKFDRETELLKKVNGHGNIVKFIETLKGGDGFYIILEFCEPGDLNRFVTETHVSADLKVPFMYDMANGLDYLHDNNIVHRDMKPGNVLVTRGPERHVCKISDFGEGKMLEIAGQSSNEFAKYMASIHGTKRYIAPEVLQNHYTSLCDVFSLGVIFYALFSKDVKEKIVIDPLVGGQRMCEVTFHQRQNALESLKTLPEQLRELTLKMLRTDYHERVACSTVKSTLNTYIWN